MSGVIYLYLFIINPLNYILQWDKFILQFFHKEQILHLQLIKKVLSFHAFSPSCSLSFPSGGPATLFSCPCSSSLTIPQSLPLLHLLEIFLKFPFVNYMQNELVYLHFPMFVVYRRVNDHMVFLTCQELQIKLCLVLNLR